MTEGLRRGLLALSKRVAWLEGLVKGELGRHETDIKRIDEELEKIKKQKKGGRDGE